MLPGTAQQLDRRIYPYTVALIPARGGSKGIPRKNLQVVGGQSLIARAVHKCLVANSVSRVYVSTEDSEIAFAARNAGAFVIPRIPELATDEASSTDVLLDALAVIDPTPEIIAWVQCTAPLFTPAEIDGTVALLVDECAALAVAGVEHHAGLVREGYAGRVHGVGWNLNGQLPRRQDSQQDGKTYEIAGSVWAVRVAHLVRTRKVYCDNTVIFPVPYKLDIDTPADLELARRIFDGPIRGTAEERRVVYPS